MPIRGYSTAKLFLRKWRDGGAWWLLCYLVRLPEKAASNRDDGQSPPLPPQYSKLNVRPLNKYLRYACNSAKRLGRLGVVSKRRTNPPLPLFPMIISPCLTQQALSKTLSDQTRSLTFYHYDPPHPASTNRRHKPHNLPPIHVMQARLRKRTPPHITTRERTLMAVITVRSSTSRARSTYNLPCRVS